MKKQLYLIGGTMGVGKTAVCQSMKRKQERSVFLDGDWCWDMHPFLVTPDTKEMVLDNISYLLNNFIHCSVCDTVIFGWVMHEQEILDTLLSRLDTEGCQVHAISLVCTKERLQERLLRDVEAGIRQRDVIVRSLERISCYEKLNTVKLDVSELSPDEAAEWILRQGEEKA